MFLAKPTARNTVKEMMVCARDDSQRRFSNATQRCNIVATFFSNCHNIVPTSFLLKSSLLDRFILEKVKYLFYL